MEMIEINQADKGRKLLELDSYSSNIMTMC